MKSWHRVGNVGSSIHSLKSRADEPAEGNRAEAAAAATAALWSAAVDSGARYGVYRTARTLGLDYSQLKRSVGSKPQTVKVVAKAAVAVKSARFVELPASTVLGAGECVVEMENARGGKLRVQFKGGDLAGLTALGSGFWGAVRFN